MKFRYLSKEAKRHALDDLRDEVAQDEWWDEVYVDAARAGISIISFDCCSPRTIKCEFTHDMEHSIKTILNDHGKECETYEIAKRYKNKRRVAEVVHAALCDPYNEDCPIDSLQDNYLEEIGRAYLKMFEEEYDYRMSGENLIDTIAANDWDFDREGNFKWIKEVQK